MLNLQQLPVLLCLAVVFCTCAKEGDKTGPPSSSAAASSAVSAPAGTVLPGLPGDYDIYLSFDLEQARRAKLLKVLLANIQGELDDFTSDCGFDASAQITHVSMAMNLPATDRDEDVSIVVRGQDRDQTMACMSKLEQIKVDGGVATLPDGSVGQFVGAKTLHYTTRGSTGLTLMDPRKGLEENSHATQLARKAGVSSMLWIVFVKNQQGLQQRLGLPLTPARGYASFDIGDGLTAKAELVMDSDADAQAMRTLIAELEKALEEDKDKLPSDVFRALQKTEVKRSGSSVTISLKLSQSEFDKTRAALMTLL